MKGNETIESNNKFPDNQVSAILDSLKKQLSEFEAKKEYHQSKVNEFSALSIAIQNAIKALSINFDNSENNFNEDSIDAEGDSIKIRKARRSHGSVMLAVLKSMSELNTFVTAEELIDYFKKKYSGMNLTSAEIRTALKDGRRTERIKRETIEQYGISKYLYGLASFYENGKIKPEYAEKFNKKSSELKA